MMLHGISICINFRIFFRVRQSNDLAIDQNQDPSILNIRFHNPDDFDRSNSMALANSHTHTHAYMSRNFLYRSGVLTKFSVKSDVEPAP